MHIKALLLLLLLNTSLARRKYKQEKNTHQIKENTYQIKENTYQIKANIDQIKENMDHTDENMDEINENTDQIEENTNQISEETKVENSDWFSDMLYRMSIFIGLEKPDKVPEEEEEEETNSWGFESIVEYAYSSLQRGYEMLVNRIPALDFRRSFKHSGNLSVNFEEILIEILLSLPPDIIEGK